ncbi:two-component system, chemotaxis family, response regulator CheB [Pseudoalteromonas citrea]|uniref:Protein-glutamate methylesterase/protein-glutamine glutaminase n=2 Tax=Pseudoalteromonas citrea TaxID=43655 RepID=A0AAD4AKH2_9GAMM|nr:chemotaxis response regulator protein-glutamate methylesterase [Pseudoalteromonas citrea]KAF7773825.1 two-component system, chemotaxis family, response regulator CheB [Pseudoalteromonas citrea]
MINVFVIDDSAVMRQVMGDIIKRDPKFKLLGAAPDPIIAERKMRSNWPDVILLDIEMPKMDGITFLKKIMEEHPTPVIIFSILTQKHSATAIEALACGAIAVVAKPTTGLTEFLQSTHVNELLDAIKGASKAKVKAVSYLSRNNSIRENYPTDAVLEKVDNKQIIETNKIIAIGASTGGTEAIGQLIQMMPLNGPPIVIVQHMPAKFTLAFSERLNSLSNHNVKEAECGEIMSNNGIYIAPGGRHLLVNRQSKDYYLEVKDGPLVSRHKPSVDVLFRSVAQSAGSNAIGIILTGMGDDGATGMLEMKKQGAVTFAQSEASCVIFGMPKEAINRGGVDKVYALENIPYQIQKLLG